MPGLLYSHVKEDTNMKVMYSCSCVVPDDSLCVLVIVHTNNPKGNCHDLGLKQQ